MKLSLRVLTCDVEVCGDNPSAIALLRECYSAFLITAAAGSRPALAYDISLIGHEGGWMLSCGETRIRCEDEYDLIYEFEKDMTERLQLLRADLFFVHGAAMSLADHCVIVSGASGSGKSSLAWCLSHLGFEYLSDELAPIDPSDLSVEPYPHALCLKDEPLSEPALPGSTKSTAATHHIPAYELPIRPPARTCGLSFLVFFDGVPGEEDMVMRGIGKAEAAARLYSNGLNQLSHQRDGLPTVAAITSTVPSYLMAGGTVESRARAIQDLFCPHN